MVKDTQASPHAEIKLTRLEEKDDVEAYLVTFERTMEALGVDRRQWSYHLAPYLTGKAQQAFACISREDCGSYDAVRVAILQRYNTTTETYYQRFVEMRKMPGWILCGMYCENERCCAKMDKGVSDERWCVGNGDDWTVSENSLARVADSNLSKAPKDIRWSSVHSRQCVGGTENHEENG